MGDNSRVRNVGERDWLWDRVLAVTPVTRYWGAGALLLQICRYFGLVPSSLTNPYWPAMMRTWNFLPILFSFFDLGPLGIPIIFKFVTLFRQGQSLERSTFLMDTPNYSFCLVIMGIAIHLLNVVGQVIGTAFFGFVPFLGAPLVYAVLTLWSRHNRTVNTSIFGVITVQAFYFPFLYLLVCVVLGDSLVAPVEGILAGHLFYFLTEIYPKLPGKGNLILTPAWFRNLFAKMENVGNVRRDSMGVMMGGGGQSENARQSELASRNPGLHQRTGAHSWGSGQRLGG